ncbi:MAG: GAF domain-containing protein [Anaerolineae bacterium]|nr:GAF domain-containing protein [Anaerolineae bacterium]
MIQIPRPDPVSSHRYVWAWTAISIIVFLLLISAIESIGYHWVDMRQGPYLTVVYVKHGGVAQQAGIQVGDKIVQVGGQPVYTRNHFSLISHMYKAGESYPLVIEREGQRLSILITGRPDEKVSTVLILSLVGGAFLAIGSIVYLVQIRDEASQVFFFTTSALALSYGLGYARSWYLALFAYAGFLVPSFVLHFFLVFPVRRAWIARRWSKYLIYLPGAILLLLAVLTSVGLLRVDLLQARSLVEIYQVAGAAVGLAILIYTAVTVKRPLVRQQTKWIIWGLAVAVLANGIFVILEYSDALRDLVEINLINWITLIVPLSFAFSIVRYRLFDIDTVINRSIVYVIVVVAILVLYIFSIQVMCSLGLDVHYDNPGFVAILVILISILLDPLRQQVQRIVDRIMYRRRPDYRQVMQEMSGEIVSTIELDQLLKLLLDHLYRVTQSEHVDIFLFDSNQQVYRRAAILGNTLQMRTLAADHPVVHALETQEALLQMPEIAESGQFAALASEAEQFMRQERLVLCLPLRTHDQLLGWLGLGIQQKGKLYALDERRFLLALADQAAIAIHNALLYRQSQEQTRQLGILHQIDNVLTSTLDLTSLLRDFLAQVVDIFGVETASVMLRDMERDELVFQVAVGSGDDMLPGVVIPLHSRSIAALVADTGSPVISNDVQADSRWYSDIDRLTHFTTRQLICVPILQRDQVIGVIEVLNRRDSAPFTQSDLDLFVLLAVQASMAIENAQLYATTDDALAERVRELAMMQEIDRQLNATLNFDHVMDLTLQWAVRLTRADAGFIGLVVSHGGQQLIEITAAEGYPVMVERGTLLADQGLLGKVVAEANLINEGQVTEQDKCCPVRPLTRSKLVAPVMREGRVIGVIDLEATDPHHFGEQDEVTVSRLTDHAAIAMENAALYEKVKRADESKTEFVNVVAHELKAPMTIIKGYTELLQMAFAESANEEDARLFHVIIGNVERMQLLINELLQLARLESHAVALDLCPNSMHSALAEVITSLRKMIDEYGTVVSLDVSANLPFVWADQMRLGEILTNLISNAIKYTPQGKSVAIKAEPYAETIEMDGQVSGKAYVRCQIQDQGIGISEDDQRKLFSRFFRADHPHVRKQPGTGLGLSIAKILVELHQGQIGASSQLGQGSTFWFTIPVAELPK